MGDQRLFHYITPYLFPVPPCAVSSLIVGFDFQAIVERRVMVDVRFELIIESTLWVDGKSVERHSRTCMIANGVAEPARLVESFENSTLGYAEITVTCPRMAVFDRILVDPGYGILKLTNSAWMTVIPDMKYARPLIIESVKATGKFCAVHTAAHVDARAGVGNSYLFINPYEKDILVRMASSAGRTLKHKAPSHTATLVSLEPLIGDKGWETVMLTASNRLPLWDVRHAYGEPFHISNLDHTEMWRGRPTHRRTTPAGLVRDTARRLLRESGLRLS